MIDLSIMPDVRGLTIREAAPLLAPLGVTALRARVVDGQPWMGTADHNLTRLNVSLDAEGRILSVGDLG